MSVRFMSSIPVILSKVFAAIQVRFRFNKGIESWTIGNAGSHWYSGAIIYFTNKQKSPINNDFSKEDVGIV
jgi:hypothetical protein